MTDKQTERSKCGDLQTTRNKQVKKDTETGRNKDHNQCGPQPSIENREASSTSQWTEP